MASTTSDGSAAPSSERHPWSLRVGRVLGIPIDVHVTFVVLLAWIGLSSVASGASLQKAAEGVGFTALVFVTVVLHELGHALVARRFGCETTRILLLPIGGVASLVKLPTRPIEEMLVAIAGPAVNVALALGLGAYLSFADPHALEAAASSDAPTLARLLWVNVALAVFNMLPAFPMDGGRVLRALMAVFVGRVRATSLAASVGQMVALGLGILGLLFQPMLALIAFFVWSAGRAEAVMEETRAAIAGLRVRRAMTTHFDTLPGDARLSEVAERILADRPHEIVVVDGDAVSGLLTRRDVLRGLAHGDLEVPLRSLMRGEVATAAPDELVLDVLPRLEASGHQTLVVVDRGRVVGVVHAESIGELMMFDRARRERRPAGQPG